jgi:transposase
MGGLANGIGQTRGGRNSKVQAVGDVKGRPCVLMITPGNVHDMKVAKACIAAMPPSAELVGDKGHDSNDLRAWLAERGTLADIPSKKNRKVQFDCDHAIYKQRNVVERMFCRFKDWRRVATRYDSNIKNFMATIAIAATVIWWLK